MLFVQQHYFTRYFKRGGMPPYNFYFYHEKPVLSYLVPEFYTVQPIAGIIYFFSFVLFVVIATLSLFSNRFKRSGFEENSSPVEDQLSTWILPTVGSSFFSSFCLLTGYFWLAMRFVGDFFPTMRLFSTLGFWPGYRFFEHRPLAQRWDAFVGIALAWISILISTLLVVSTNSRLINLLTRHFPILR